MFVSPLILSFRLEAIVRGVFMLIHGPSQIFVSSSVFILSWVSEGRAAVIFGQLQTRAPETSQTLSPSPAPQRTWNRPAAIDEDCTCAQRWECPREGE